MNLQENYSLKADNTFRIDVKAKYFVVVQSIEELKEILSDDKFKHEKKLVLGDGANILFTKDYDGLVIKLKLKGINVVNENDEFVILDVSAGENWHEFVMYTIDKNWGGVENMVYIPGTVGAAAVQNIAAYGQNLSDVFVSLDAIEILTGNKITFTKDGCEFEYRDSRFKTREMGKYIVTNIRLKLNKNPVVNTSYFETGKTIGNKISLAGELAGIENPTISDVANAVMTIRKNKLPDIREVGTAGSFFKNPIVTQEKYQDLKKSDPDLQCYPVDGLRYVSPANLVKESEVKVPAGRLLDNLGWKGKRVGNVGTHPTQALAVVNYGGTGEEVLDFSEEMKKAIKAAYDIELEKEVLVL